VTVDISNGSQKKTSEKNLVFIVENDIEIALRLSHTMDQAGFAARIFLNGQAVLEALPTQLPSLILLERMLPDMDGLRVLRLLKTDQRLMQIKVVLLSALVSEDDLVYALDFGVDDYVIKPFSEREIAARVRAILRGGQYPANHRVLQVGDLIADRDSRRLTLDGREVPCSTREFDLLVHFMQHVGEIVSRRVLLDRFWLGKKPVEDRIVDIYIRKLRAKIEADAANPTRLVTRRGWGYTFEVPN
jgi:DNA-binding response OmpR family regulator